MFTAFNSLYDMIELLKKRPGRCNMLECCSRLKKKHIADLEVEIDLRFQ